MTIVKNTSAVLTLEAWLMQRQIGEDSVVEGPVEIAPNTEHSFMVSPTQYVHTNLSGGPGPVRPH